MARPPPGRGSAVMVAPWAVAIALTMDRPRPWPPPRRAGRGPSRWKGWNRRAAAGAGGVGAAGGGGVGLEGGQAEAVAAAAAGGARAEPLEGLEQAVDVGGRDDLPGAAHRQDGAGVAGPGGDLDVPAGGILPDRVVDQVGGQLLDQEGVTVEGGGLDVGLDVQAQAADRGAGGGQGGAGDSGQVAGLALAGAGFAAGQ